MVRKLRSLPPADDPVFTEEEEEDVASLLADETNPWTYLTTVGTRVPVARRAPYYARWMELITARSYAERDALIGEGQPVFRYTLGTIRDAMKQADKRIKGDIVAITNLNETAYMAEMVYRPGETPSVGFLVHWYDKPNESPEFVDKIVKDGKTYLPLASFWAEKNIVNFPATVEEFGSQYALFERIRDFIDRIVWIENKAFRDLACCYVMMTWMYDRFETVPYLRFQGDFETGKTQMLKTIGHLCYRPAFVGGAITASPIFRAIDLAHPTLIIDEADFTKSDSWEEIDKILNLGYTRGQPIWRTERINDVFMPNAYDCYGPKILASRRRFSDSALESRCLSLITSPLPDDLTANYPSDFYQRFKDEARQLRNRLLWWRFKSYQSVTLDEIIEFPGVGRRGRQILRPIYSIASDPSLQQMVISMATTYTASVKTERAGSFEGVVLNATLQRWIAKKGVDRFLMKEVVELMKEGDDYSKTSAQKVSGALINLKIETQRLGGGTWVFLRKPLAISLNREYGLGYEKALADIPDPVIKGGKRTAVLPPSPPPASTV